MLPDFSPKRLYAARELLGTQPVTNQTKTTLAICFVWWLLKVKYFMMPLKKISYMYQSAPSIMQICDIEHYRYVNK